MSRLEPKHSMNFKDIDNKTSQYGSKMSDFRVLTELGKGSYGTVFKVESLKDHKIYVLKRTSLNTKSSKH